MPSTPPAESRTPYGANLHPAALPASLAEIYLAAAHNHRMGCLHAREPAAPYLPIQASQKPTPHPPIPPGGMFSASRNLADCSESTTYGTISSFQQAKESRFSVDFRSKSRVFRAVLGIFCGVAEVRSQRNNAIAEHDLRSTPRRKAMRFGIELPQLADLHLQRCEVDSSQAAGGGHL